VGATAERAVCVSAAPPCAGRTERFPANLALIPRSKFGQPWLLPAAPYLGTIRMCRLPCALTQLNFHAECRTKKLASFLPAAIGTKSNLSRMFTCVLFGDRVAMAIKLDFNCCGAGAQEEPMELYEIRIIGADQAPVTNFEQHYINDEAAIRSARHFADDRPFQVWRRSLCVYYRKADADNRRDPRY
jgi:hypothetical protein